MGKARRKNKRHCETTRGTRFEISTTGFDAALQGVGAGANGQAYSMGLIIPPTVSTADPANRYLFLLAMFQVPARMRARIVGLRQFLSMSTTLTSGEGSSTCQYVLEQEITSPFWRFMDGNVSWHLTRVPSMKFNTNHPGNANELQFLYANTPALVFQQTPTDGYIPPNGGVPYGTSFVPDLAGFTDMRFPWQNTQQFALDVETQGDCDIALWASVLQTTQANRCPLVLPGGITLCDVGPEDQFVYNFPNAVYHRIAGSLIVETEDFYPFACKGQSSRVPWCDPEGDDQ